MLHENVKFYFKVIYLIEAFKSPDNNFLL